MSMSKRLLFDNDPADAARERLRALTRDHLAPFVHRLPLRRRNPNGWPYWDPLWRAAVLEAARALGVETAIVNGALRLKSVEDRDAVRAGAGPAYNALRRQTGPG